MADRYRIRRARRTDIRALAEIERCCFPDPWPSVTFASLLGQLSAVVALGSEVVGYVFGRVSGQQGEILNLAVKPDHRRRGLAHELVFWVLAEFARHGAHDVLLEVRESNTGARSLYESLGFREVARQKGYYRRPLEDAVVMKREERNVI